MKNSITVACNIYDKFNERWMKAFGKKVASILRQNEIFGDVICLNSWMEKGNGSGSYNFCAQIEVDSEELVLKSHTNNSEAWDNWDEPSAKDKRNLFLSVLENEIDTLKNEIL